MPPAPEPLHSAEGDVAWILRGPAAPLPTGDVWDLIRASLERRTAAIVLSTETAALTGADLLHAVDGFPALPAGAFVGVHVSRSAALVIAALATWRCGSTYVPLATELPAARVAAMAANCRPAAIVTDGSDDVFEGYISTGRVEAFGRTLRVLAAVGGGAGVRPTGSVPCYVAHTSGTSGTPKAVLVSQAALLNRTVALRGMIEPRDTDAVLFKTSLVFDVHVWEFVLPLAADCRLVVYEQERYFDLRRVGRLLVRERVTVAGFVPTLLNALLDRAEVTDASALRIVFCGGEAWGPALARKLRDRLPGCVLRNSYGPAETTLAVANWRVPDDEVPTRIELGPPLVNTVFMVEDADEPIDGRVVGSLAIGGRPVADGYLQPARPDPFFERMIGDVATRFYRTGDRVELDLATGALFFRGRQDGQLKLNGVRVEPEEIEAAVRTLDEVEESVVVLAPSGATSVLVATYRTRGNDRLDASRVRSRCEALLPPTHVPSLYRQVERYEATPSGKIDRRRVRDDLDDNRT